MLKSHIDRIQVTEEILNIFFRHSHLKKNVRSALLFCSVLLVRFSRSSMHAPLGEKKKEKKSGRTET